ncbi:MAG TPA: hypothetical protein VGF25_05950 [Thermoleophilaceae bacterium]|jgi:hypothetical protein
MGGFRHLAEARRESQPLLRPLNGRAVVERVALTGVTNDENPEVELILAVELPGRESYTAAHRQVVSRYVKHNLVPGSTVPVRVDAADPSRLEIG